LKPFLSKAFSYLCVKSLNTRPGKSFNDFSSYIPTGLIISVEPSQSVPSGVWHLVQIEYTDTEGEAEETLIWEYEPQAKLLELIAFPKIEET
jgi:hypothetical protein